MKKTDYYYTESKSYLKLGAISFLLLSVSITLNQCTSLGYTEYVVSPPTQINPAIREKGTEITNTKGKFDEKAMQIRYNNGKTVTEVSIPMLSTGQTVVISHDSKPASFAPDMVAPIPTDLDKELEKKYIDQGGKINKSSDTISLYKANGQVQAYIQKGNFDLALEIIEKVLKRFPDHSQFLRMKGSCLLSTGEKQSAIDAYQKAYNIEPDAQLKEMLDKLNNETRGN